MWSLVLFGLFCYIVYKLYKYFNKPGDDTGKGDGPGPGGGGPPDEYPDLPPFPGGTIPSRVPDEWVEEYQEWLEVKARWALPVGSPSHKQGPSA